MMSDEMMMKQFEFTEADLQANERGLLSESQQARWRKAGAWSGSMMKTAVPLVFALLAVTVGLIISAVIGRIVLGGLITLILAVVGAVVIRLVMGGGQKAEPLSLAVGRAEGVAHLKETLDSDEHDMTRRYKLEIDHHTFQLFRKTQFEALENGAKYVVYYYEDAGHKYIISLRETK
jgi:hypothetical protein